MPLNQTNHNVKPYVYKLMELRIVTWHYDCLQMTMNL